jgi:hypothetical protein
LVIEMTPELETAIYSLCDSLSQLWSLDLFKGDSPLYREGSEKAITEVEETAKRLPITGRVIRGLTGVKVTFSRELDRKSLTKNLLCSSDETPRSYHTDKLQEAFSAIQKHISSIKQEIENDDKLSYRLEYPALFKSRSYDEFIENKKAYKCKYPDYIPNNSGGILELIAKHLVSSEFNPDDRHDFCHWQDIKEGVVNTLREIERLNEYDYEVRIFLNGPLIDQLEDIPWFDLSINNRAAQVFLGYATDDLLTSLANGEKIPSYIQDSIIGVEKINTIARYHVSIPVEAGADEYNIHYGYASYLAEIILDSLRLHRPLDDIGIIAIEIYPLSPFAPHIRKTENNAYNYQSYLAPYKPERFDFSLASVDPLNKEELESISRIILLRLSSDTPKNKKIEYAIKRFRNSIERYSPDDPERLLEYAIALEAIYLNDNSNHDELTYRLRLRAARFLKENYGDRDKLFKLIGDLYSFRSTVAHGGDISTSTKKKKKERDEEQEKLKQVLEEIPGVLAESILKIMNEHYEEHNTGESLFWRKIELQ